MLESLLSCQQFCQVFINHQMTLNVDSDFWTTINDLKIALGPAKITSYLLQDEQLYSGDCLLEWKKCIINIRKISNYYNIINSIYCIKLSIIFILHINCILYFLDSFISNTIVEAMQRREITLFNCNSFKFGIFLDGRVNVLLDEITIREAKNHLIFLSSELHNENNIDLVIIEQPSILSNHIEDNEVDDLELEFRTAAADRRSGLVSRQEQIVLDIQNEIVSFMQLPRK